MKFSRLLALGVLLSLLFTTNGLAERMYILFDDACMERLEYRLIRPDGRTDFITYHVNVRAGEKMILEIGTESSQEQNYLPENYLTCAEAAFDDNLRDRINGNVDEIFLVYPKNNRSYVLSPVTLAAKYMKSGSTITYQSPKYSFQVNLNNVSIGTNIAYNNPGATVYFEGRLNNNDCDGSYVFRQLQPQSAYPLIDVTLVPEVGVIEERSGPNATAAMNNRLELQQIAGKRLDRYVRENCGNEPGSNKNTASNQRPDEFFRAPVNNNVRNTAPIPPGEPTEASAFHTVAKGETLWAIAKKNNTSVDQIRSLNNISGNTIRVGQQLKVREATASTSQPTFNTNSTATTNQPQRRPELISRGSQQQQPLRGSGNTVDASSYHSVQRGETVASIALKYGYTEAKFREINGMGSNEYIRVGQLLKVNDCQCPDNTTAVTRPSPANTTTGITNSPGRVLPSEIRTPEPVPYNQNNQTGRRINGDTPLPSTRSLQPGYNPSSNSRTNTNQTSNYNQPYEASRGGAPGTYSPPSNNNNNNQPYYGTQSRTPQPQSRQPLYNQPRTNYNQPNYGNDQGNSDFNDDSGFDNSPNFGTQPQSFSNNRTTSRSPSLGRIESSGTTNQPRYYSSSDTPLQPDNYNSAGNEPIYNPYGNSTNRKVHIVQDGESLYAIARRYNLQVDELRRMNGLSAGEVIIPYQRIYLE